MVYTLEEAQRNFVEILEKIRSGHRVVIQENGEDFAEIMPLNPPVASDSTEQAYFELERQGILSMSKILSQDIGSCLDEK
ncbi:MAG TPA: hypothetical protein VF789_24065 [Thermoanaerobaculia bacterium]